MSDTQVTLGAKPSSITRKIVTGILLSGWIVSVLLILSIVASSVWLQVSHPDVQLPDTLREWSGIAIGFLFGNFFTIVKEYVSANQDF